MLKCPRNIKKFQMNLCMHMAAVEWVHRWTSDVGRSGKLGTVIRNPTQAVVSRFNKDRQFVVWFS